MTRKKLTIISSLVIGSALLAACSSKVQYVDPNAVDTTNIYFGSTDLQTTAQKMVDGLLTFPPIVQLTAKQRPVIFVDAIKNQTNEQINTDSIGNMIMTELLQSGKFRFVDMSAAQGVRNQLNYQQGSGLVDPASAVKVGQQIGAQYMLYGAVSSIQKTGNGEESMYYLISMRLLNLQTGLVEWADQKQIRKVKN